MSHSQSLLQHFKGGGSPHREAVCFYEACRCRVLNYDALRAADRMKIQGFLRDVLFWLAVAASAFLIKQDRISRQDLKGHCPFLFYPVFFC